MTLRETRQELWAKVYAASIGAPMTIPDHAADRALAEFDKRFEADKYPDLTSKQSREWWLYREPTGLQATTDKNSLDVPSIHVREVIE